MASFSYVVIDKNGKEKKGVMEGTNEATVKANLKAEGNIPLSVSEASAFSKDVNISIGGGVKPRDLSMFCRQMVGILGAGVSVMSALQMLGEQTENKNLKKSIKEVQSSVEKGETLASAMKKERKVFPGILLNMVEAGEASGSLDIAFDRMAIHFEKDSKIRAMVKQAMVYPIIVAIVAVGVICIMMVAVIPNFIGMFEQMDMELPTITKAVIAMSDFIVGYWWLLIIIITGMVAGVIYIKKSPSGARFFGKLGLKTPLFGALTVKSSSSRLARTLSTLLAAGVPMIDAIDITARTMSNIIVTNCLIHAKEEVERGVTLSTPLEASGIFPPMVYHMTRIGEETGNLENMLNKVADYYDEEVENATKALTSVMEPLVIVLLALVVGALIMSIMAPMMGMYTGIENM
jgi:type IV pilus assembly protein PilC